MSLSSSVTSRVSAKSHLSTDHSMKACNRPNHPTSQHLKWTKFQVREQNFYQYGWQTWYLSKNLHDRIFATNLNWLNHQSSISYFVENVKNVWAWWRPCLHGFVDFRRMNSTKYLVLCAHHTILSKFMLYVNTCVRCRGVSPNKNFFSNIRSKYS